MSESKTIVFNQFARSEVLKLTEEQPFCAICHLEFGSKNPPEAHSATTLHVVDGKATSVHDGFKYMLGKEINPRLLELLGGKDGFMLCQGCHDELHASALLEEKIRNPNFKGSVASPAVLVEILCQAMEREGW